MLLYRLELASRAFINFELFGILPSNIKHVLTVKRSWTSLKPGDLETYKILVPDFLKLYIDHLNVSDRFENQLP